MVVPVVAWCCLCLVKLCGTHLTSAFSVSGIHCYNYAIMSLYSFTSDCTPPPPPFRSGKMPQLDVFFVVVFCLIPHVLLVFSAFLCGSYRFAALNYNFILFVSHLVDELRSQ